MQSSSHVSCRANNDGIHAVNVGAVPSVTISCAVPHRDDLHCLPFASQRADASVFLENKGVRGIAQGRKGERMTAHRIWIWVNSTAACVSRTGTVELCQWYFGQSHTFDGAEPSANRKPVRCRSLPSQPYSMLELHASSGRY